MFNKKIYTLIALASINSLHVYAQPEISGKITLESASFTNNGTSTGASSKSNVSTTHGEDNFKNEISARIYVDGQFNDSANSSYHLELQGYDNSEAIADYDNNESYTQRDPLREAYVDTSFNDTLLRVGKQQVVWGTADGMKLLDAINPTDYSEVAQNQMEDSRIPVWMVNADFNDSNGGNWQFILAESKASHLAGMGSASTSVGDTHYSISDTGHPFIMKGVDTISGKVNGFINVVPALGNVSTAFYLNGNSSAMNMASVNDFAEAANAGETNQAAGFGALCNGGVSNVSCLEDITNQAAAPTGGAAANNQFAQNLFSDYTLAQWTAGKSNPTSVYHYMPDATFATFDQFVDAQSRYVVDHDETPTIAARYKNTTESGMNYSLNLIHGNDTNPYIDHYWTDGGTGAVLAENPVASSGGVYVTNQLGSGTVVGGSTKRHNHAIYNMVEKLNKITQLGGSFDTTLETDSLGPVVIRAEALYQKDVMSPVITRKASNGADLNHGFLVTALKMTKGDRFKYVLGADITVLTNMMISAQLIQDMNLDYVDVGSPTSANWKYTGDMATMHLTNGLQKAEKNKEFVSIFLSKPFGESGQHRWNNIFIFEENGGKWNRFDTEYTIDDDTIATLEWNKYTGNTNTQFGQFKDQSNIQLGLKYLF